MKSAKRAYNSAVRMNKKRQKYKIIRLTASVEHQISNTIEAGGIGTYFIFEEEEKEMFETYVEPKVKKRGYEVAYLSIEGSPSYYRVAISWKG